MLLQNKNITTQLDSFTETLPSDNTFKKKATLIVMCEEIHSENDIL